MTKVKSMTCAVCGSHCRNRQWPNRDTGFGLCRRCIPWLEEHGTAGDELRRLYGERGIHFDIEGEQE